MTMLLCKASEISKQTLVTLALQNLFCIIEFLGLRQVACIGKWTLNGPATEIQPISRTIYTNKNTNIIQNYIVITCCRIKVSNLLIFQYYSTFILMFQHKITNEGQARTRSDLIILDLSHVSEKILINLVSNAAH